MLDCRGLVALPAGALDGVQAPLPVPVDISRPPETLGTLVAGRKPSAFFSLSLSLSRTFSFLGSNFIQFEFSFALEFVFFFFLPRTTENRHFLIVSRS